MALRKLASVFFCHIEAKIVAFQAMVYSYSYKVYHRVWKQICCINQWLRLRSFALFNVRLLHPFDKLNFNAMWGGKCSLYLFPYICSFIFSAWLIDDCIFTNLFGKIIFKFVCSTSEMCHKMVNSWFLEEWYKLSVLLLIAFNLKAALIKWRIR